MRGVETALVPTLEREGMGLLPYFPLASGLLTGKYEQGKDIPAGTRYARMGRFGERYMTEENWRIVEGLTAFAKSKGHTLAGTRLRVAGRAPVPDQRDRRRDAARTGRAECQGGRLEAERRRRRRSRTG